MNCLFCKVPMTKDMVHQDPVCNRRYFDPKHWDEQDLPRRERRRRLHLMFLKTLDLAGGNTRYAAICGITKQMVSQMKRMGSYVPKHHVPLLAKALKIHSSEMRPDLCHICQAKPIREVLDGDQLCHACCNGWVRAEGLMAQARNKEEVEVIYY